MSLEFKLRRVVDYADCKLHTDGANIDLGFLDRQQATELLEQFKGAVDDLEWFLQVTEK